MSDRIFVDTNILLYAHDAGAGSKHDQARKLIEHIWQSGGAIISTQVIQEFAFNLQRKLKPPMPIDDVRVRVALYAQWTVVLNSSTSVLDALALQQQHHVSFWDALILQAAIAAGAEVIYSEDLADGQEYGRVRVVNPLQ